MPSENKLRQVYYTFLEPPHFLKITIQECGRYLTKSFTYFLGPILLKLGDNLPSVDSMACLVPFGDFISFEYSVSVSSLAVLSTRDKALCWI